MGVPMPKVEAPKAYPTFTTKKRVEGFMMLAGEYDYSAKPPRPIKGSVYLDLKRGEEFDPVQFCERFRGLNWKPGELKPNRVIEFLDTKARLRDNSVCRWKDRPRPISQIVLEEALEGAAAERDKYKAENEEQAKIIVEMQAKLDAMAKGGDGAKK